LVALLGKDGSGLSPSTAARLKDAWSEERVRWSKRDLSANAIRARRQSARRSVCEPVCESERNPENFTNGCYRGHNPSEPTQIVERFIR
jgi:hypothetical protein